MSEADLDLRFAGIDAIKDAMNTYSSSNTDFFSIKEDEQIAQVTFAHGDDKDLDIYVVHKVAIGGNDKYVACLSPAKVVCPFCSAGLKPTIRLFLTLDDKRDGKRKLWDRGKNDIPSILGLIGRYGRMDSRPYDIQRHGKKGDKETKYQYFPLDPFPTGTVISKREPILSENGFVQRKTPDEMTAMLPSISAPSNGGYGAQSQQQAPAGKMF